MLVKIAYFSQPPKKQSEWKLGTYFPGLAQGWQQELIIHGVPCGACRDSVWRQGTKFTEVHLRLTRALRSTVRGSVRCQVHAASGHSPDHRATASPAGFIWLGLRKWPHCKQLTPVTPGSGCRLKVLVKMQAKLCNTHTVRFLPKRKSCRGQFFWDGDGPSCQTCIMLMSRPQMKDQRLVYKLLNYESLFISPRKSPTFGTQENWQPWTTRVFKSFSQLFLIWLLPSSLKSNLILYKL